MALKSSDDCIGKDLGSGNSLDWSVGDRFAGRASGAHALKVKADYPGPSTGCLEKHRGEWEALGEPGRT